MVHKFGLDALQANHLRDQLLQGLITHLYSVAVGLRVSDQLTLDYPELLEFESQHVERELQTNAEGLSEQSRAALPHEVFDATHKLNTAYACTGHNVWKSPRSSIPIAHMDLNQQETNYSKSLSVYQTMRRMIMSWWMNGQRCWGLEIGIRG